MAKTDAAWMQLAIAKSRFGIPAPNPHVGCVIVKEGQLVGTGYHRFVGDAHAEIHALKKAGDRAKGATAYVTLEPCNHHGRTGPCSHALLEAGVSRVVIAVSDPNPVASGGAEFLRQNGLEVILGEGAEQAKSANWQFLASQACERAVVTVKVAMSLDGRIALPNGESKWITGESARRDGRLWRSRCGAVLVGRRTVEIDDPHLTVRAKGLLSDPLKIVLDPGSKLSSDRKIFQSSNHWHVTGDIDLNELLQGAFRRDVRGVLVEGGAETITRFWRANLVDQLVVYVAPKVLGSGMNWIGDFGLGSLAESGGMRLIETKRFGEDVRLRYRVRNHS
jgi:diaminohydroxyphosphoribosylaminopyrimidine deaminase/5-amino-6-(5-phosphoribosylamino)uracil reductase